MKQSLTFLFLLFFVPVSSYGAIIDRVVAIVNDEVVTLSEIDEAEYLMANNVEKTKQGKDGQVTVKKQIIERFIEKKLQLQKAQQLNIKATDENINDAIQEIKDKNNIPSDRELEQVLKLQGLTLKELRKQIAERIKIAKLINRKVRSKVQVDEEEIRAYYREHLVEYRLQEELHARHILLQVPENASSATEKKIRLRIEKIADDLGKGTNFIETARKYSESPDAEKGGDLGYFKRGQMIPEIDRVVFALQPGKRSDIVRTPFGFHIFEVIDRKEHTIDNDPDIRKEIENKINRKKTEKLLEKFIKELKVKAYISITEGT